MAQPQANQPTRGSSSIVGRPAIAVSTTISLLALYWLRSSCTSLQHSYALVIIAILATCSCDCMFSCCQIYMQGTLRRCTAGIWRTQWSGSACGRHRTSEYMARSSQRTCQAAMATVKRVAPHASARLSRPCVRSVGTVTLRCLPGLVRPADSPKSVLMLGLLGAPARVLCQYCLCTKQITGPSGNCWFQGGGSTAYPLVDSAPLSMRPESDAEIHKGKG